MIVQNEQDIESLHIIGRIVTLTMRHMAEHMHPGMTTIELDKIGAKFLEEHGANSGPKLAYDFPGYTCISINEQVAHAPPSNRIIQAGDLVNIDVSAEKDGYWADTGGSFAVAPVSSKNQKLLDCTKEALEIAINHARAGVPVNEIGKAVEQHANRHGYHILQQLAGHGVGRGIHEEPSIPNFYNRHAGEILKEGMVIALEPFICSNTRHIVKMRDGWTLRTRDGSLGAQFEHTLIVTDGRPIIVTEI